MWWLWLLIGTIFGSIVSSIIFFVTHPHRGMFKIDKSNPDKDIYRLCIDDLDKVSKKKYMTLKIDKNADLSQE